MCAWTRRWRDSPIHLVPAAAGPLILGGESDEFHRQKRDYAARWEAAGLALEEVLPPGLDRFAVMDDFAAPGGAIFRAVDGLTAGA